MGDDLERNVGLEVEEGIARLRLRRPAARNALTPALVGDLLDAVRSPVVAGARALVLSGEGPIFCSGVDLTVLRRTLADGDLGGVLTSLLDGLHTAIRALRALPVPVIAAVDGAAAGAGLGLALAADLRVAGRSAVFVPAYLAIGASPDGGVSFHLTRALGGPRAAAAIIRNRRLGAAELAAAGLVEQVVDDGEAEASAVRLAAEVAGTAPLALLALRRLVDAAPTHGLDAHLDLEAETIRSVSTSADFAEGVAAFLERRPPDFLGR